MNSIDSWKILNLEEDNIFSARWGHSAILYENQIVIFGGFRNDIYNNELFALDLETLKIRSVVSISPPSPRSNHSCVKYKDENNLDIMIIHGGVYEKEDFNDTYFLYLENFAWKKIDTKGSIPPQSSEHSADIYREYMIIVGGEAQDDMNDKIRILNIRTLSWKIFNPPEKIENLFNRIFHSSSLLESKLYIYSGSNINYLCYNDMIILNFQNFDFQKNTRLDNYEYINYDNYKYGNEALFTKHRVKAAKLLRYPYPRWGANLMVKNSNCLLLFGGRNKKDFSDLWIFSTTQKIWLEVKVPKQKILPRRKSTTIIVENMLIVIGGYCDDFFNDINMINLNNLDFYKTYEEKLLAKIPKSPKDKNSNVITFRLKNKKSVSFDKEFFLKNLKINVGNCSNTTSSSNVLHYYKSFSEGVLNQNSIHEDNKASINNLFHEGANNNTSNFNKNIVIELENKNLTEHLLRMFYEISFTGKLFSYVTVKDIQNLMEFSAFLKENYLYKKLESILTSIKTSLVHEQNFSEDKELFNLSNYTLMRENSLYSKSFYNLRDKTCPTRKLISLHSKTLLKFIDSTEDSADFFSYISEKTFGYLLLFMINSQFPKADENINDLLEILFYSKFFIIKSLFKEIQFKLINYIYLNTIPILVIFAFKYDAQIILNHILKFIVEKEIYNWEEYLYTHLYYLSSNFFILNIMKFLKEYFLKNKLYFKIIQKTEMNNKVFKPIFSLDFIHSVSINILSFNKVIKEELFEKDLAYVPIQHIRFYNNNKEKNSNDFDNIAKIPRGPNGSIDIGLCKKLICNKHSFKIEK